MYVSDWCMPLKGQVVGFLGIYWIFVWLYSHYVMTGSGFTSCMAFYSTLKVHLAPYRHSYYVVKLTFLQWLVIYNVREYAMTTSVCVCVRVLDGCRRNTRVSPSSSCSGPSRASSRKVQWT